MEAEHQTLRADAARNRAAILGAATAMFSERGMDISLDEVAREAGVGVATLYRRFPTRDSLVEAVFDEKMMAYADSAVAAADLALTQPWDAFRGYVHYILEEQASDAAFAYVLIAPLTGSPVFAAQHRRALEATVLLVRRATDAGVLRDGFDHSDLYMLTLANAGLVSAARGSGVEASRRLATFILDGFRAGANDELPPVPKVWARAMNSARSR